MACPGVVASQPLPMSMASPGLVAAQPLPVAPARSGFVARQRLAMEMARSNFVASEQMDTACGKDCFLRVGSVYRPVYADGAESMQVPGSLPWALVRREDSEADWQTRAACGKRVGLGGVCSGLLVPASFAGVDRHGVRCPRLHLS